jgi:hypothetical protein
MLEVLLFALLAILVGIGLSFFGYAAFRIILPILGFLVGLWLGMDLVNNFMGNYPLLGVSLGLVVGFILGGVFAAIAYFVYSLAVVIFGVSLGYALGAGIMLMLGMSDGFLTFLVGAIAAVGMAVLFMATNMPKVYIMALTAFAGASALIAGVLVLFGQIPPSQLGLAVVDPYIANSLFWLIVWMVVGFLGFFVQYRMVQVAESMVPESYSYEVVTKEAKAKSS